MYWRVFFRKDQDLPQVDDVLSVQPQFNYGCASYWCHANQFGEVAAPRKMFLPGITARMKERNFLKRDRINPCRFGVLVIVAALTSKRQIVFLAAATEYFRNDVLN